MATPLRTFVALRVGAACRARLAREAGRLARLDDALRVPEEGDLHLTVQFLGDTREEDVPAVGRALAAAAASSGPVAVAYRGLGAFPDARRARVVWVGLADDPPGRLAALARAVGEGLLPLGHPPEGRAFHAHVTLGRLRRPPNRALVEAVEGGRGADLGAETLSDLKLILSRPDGSRYHYIDLTTVRLGGPAS